MLISITATNRQLLIDHCLNVRSTNRDQREVNQLSSIPVFKAQLRIGR